MICAFGFLFFGSSCNRCPEYKNEPVWADTSKADSARLEAGREFFDKLNEPIVEELEHEAYRLLIIQSLSKNHFLFRIDADELRFKEFARFARGDTLVDTILQNQKILLTEQHWIEFQNLVRQQEYWTMPASNGRHGLDGTSWTLTGRRPQAAECRRRTWHRVHRWSPEEGGFRTLCEKMLEMAEEHGVDLSTFYQR